VDGILRFRMTDRMVDNVKFEVFAVVNMKITGFLLLYSDRCICHNMFSG
jgi:hypothetical protein